MSKTRRPRLVITDVPLPGMDVPELMPRPKPNARYWVATIPATASYALEGYKDKVSRPVAVGAVTKPVGHRRFPDIAASCPAADTVVMQRHRPGTGEERMGIVD